MEATTTKGGALTGQERRAEIMNILRQSTMPLSGAALGKQLGVSRQVVVQDIALLRQSGEEIYATNRGYVTGVANARPKRLFKVHHTIEQTGDELNLMVDHGVVVENVIVNHRTYGRLSANLGFRNRRDVALPQRTCHRSFHATDEHHLGLSFPRGERRFRRGAR